VKVVTTKKERKKERKKEGRKDKERERKKERKFVTKKRRWLLVHKRVHRDCKSAQWQKCLKSQWWDTEHLCLLN
jgi:hypothetical protein